jgi:hypothetical protein
VLLGIFEQCALGALDILGFDQALYFTLGFDFREHSEN